MAPIIISGLLIVVAFGALLIRRKRTGSLRLALGAVAGALVALTALVLLLASYYSQDAGEARVQKSFTGELVGQTTTAGAHWKAPWVSTVNYDVRNNTVSYIGAGTESTYSGGNATGPQITFQDKDGVTGNLDLVVRYSIQPDAVLDIYASYDTQESFVTKVVTNDIRSVTRNIPSKYGTIEVYNNRDTIEAEIREALEQRWADDGLVVEEVGLQEIRYSEETRQRFDDAQAARIAVDKAEADQQKATVEAETKKIEAQGLADANAALTQSLTPEVLQQRYIDALSKASTIYVVPEGSTPMVGVAPNVSTPAASE